MIKAIETVYNGYRFRSRLEARWAVFFDTQDIEYDYEPEGFDLGEIGRYLPDFFLPQVNMWAEVKPKALTPQELAKCRALALGTGESCLMLIGPPAKQEYDAFKAEWGIEADGRRTCRVLRVGYSVARTKWLDGENRFPAWFCFTPEMFDDCIPGYAEAVLAARQARFERGAR